MKIIIINPPLLQQNTAYPSGAYLSSFFKKMGHEVLWKDLNIALFYKIFSKEGLSCLFELTKDSAIKMAMDFQKKGDDITAFNLRRYVSSQKEWINWIDFITDALCGCKNSTREKEHEFLFSPFSPRGNRMENFLNGLEREPGIDDMKFLCTYALADLSDYISMVFDQGFELIRYAESISVDDPDFNIVEKQMKSPVMKEFYLPLLHDLENEFSDFANGEETMICISVPFAGTFVPSLVTADFFKNNSDLNPYIVLGGGYINTQLRHNSSGQLAKYCDALSFDRGYGSYKAFFEKMSQGDSSPGSSLYKMRIFRYPFCKEPLKNPLEPLWQEKETSAFEDQMTRQIIPDYSQIDFSVYPRLCDDKNPMHRLWSDGAWIKAYLAHGCYWHRCAFCDTKLDYVCSYRPVDEKALFEGLLKTARENHLYGIHFVDEALPPAILKKFALLNARLWEKSGQRFYYWGNVRFEKAFTKDLAAFLAYCGFGAVSAGLEVATTKGLENINKGTDLNSIIASCAAFKEAGILVHAYMIYGFWYDTPQTIIDSMETLRQFFELGLLDSSFWHKFMLTRDSHAYDELKGKWKGGKEYEKFGPGLEAALDSWMHGQKLETKVTRWFDFEVPGPSIPKNLVEKAIEKYEEENNNLFNLRKDFPAEDLYWLGTAPVGDDRQLNWIYLQEEMEVKNGGSELSKILWALRPGADDGDRAKSVEQIKKTPALQKVIKSLHYKGIVVV